MFLEFVDGERLQAYLFKQRAVGSLLIQDTNLRHNKNFLP